MYVSLEVSVAQLVYIYTLGRSNSASAALKVSRLWTKDANLGGQCSIMLLDLADTPSYDRPVMLISSEWVSISFEA
jgi:hypothetical protein